MPVKHDQVMFVFGYPLCTPKLGRASKLAIPIEELL
jgi:hypothetical protein